MIIQNIRNMAKTKVYLEIKTRENVDENILFDNKDNTFYMASDKDFIDIEDTNNDSNNMLRNILKGSFKFFDADFKRKFIIKLDDAHRNLNHEANIYVCLYLYFFFFYIE